MTTTTKPRTSKSLAGLIRADEQASAFFASVQKTTEQTADRYGAGSHMHLLALERLEAAESRAIEATQRRRAAERMVGVAS